MHDATYDPQDAPPPLRSMLFVPGDSERKLASAARAGADALILDLEDSVDPARKPYARELIAAYLVEKRPSSGTVWVRINALDTFDSRTDLDVVVAAAPDGVVLPKPRSPADIVRLSRQLDELERAAMLTPGRIRILPIVTETPSSVLTLNAYSRSSLRLAALTWGAEDLGTALGAETTVDERGDWLPPYELVRSLCLLGAADAAVPAIDTVYTSFRDAQGFERQARAAKRDGFVGKLAIHPDQVGIANAVFRPSDREIERARRIVEAFEASSGAGVVALDGRMLDRPHLLRARRVLAAAASGNT